MFKIDLEILPGGLSKASTQGSSSRIGETMSEAVSKVVEDQLRLHEIGNLVPGEKLQFEIERK